MLKAIVYYISSWWKDTCYAHEAYKEYVAEKLSSLFSPKEWAEEAAYSYGIAAYEQNKTSRAPYSKKYLREAWLRGWKYAEQWEEDECRGIIRFLELCGL
jgi:ribosome modulation factor